MTEIEHEIARIYAGLRQLQGSFGETENAAVTAFSHVLDDALFRIGYLVRGGSK